MRLIVTGSSGFIGSHLAATLREHGHEVTGIDRNPGKETDVFADVALLDPSVLHGADAVFHVAAQPGVRQSWTEFGDYVHDNIMATHNLLTTMHSAGVPRLVYSSSSSIYGDATGPTTEHSPTLPLSPYGVTKLAAERLCFAHLPDTVALRYFTVIGERGRTDMATHLLLTSTADRPFRRFGTGQARSFTYVGDVVRANIMALDWPPGAYNIGGTHHSLDELIDACQEVRGEVHVIMSDEQRGDARTTWADCSKANAQGWHPEVSMLEAVRRQYG